MMKLAVTTTTPDVPLPSPVALLRGPFAVRALRAAALGLDGLELMALEPAALDPAALRHALDRTGLEVAAIASGAQATQAGLTLLAADAATRARALHRLLELIDLAQALGAPLVTIGGFRGRLAAVAPQEGRTLLVAALRSAAAHAAARGVRLALEPLTRTESDCVTTVAEGLALIDAAACDALGLLVDTYHAHREEASLAGALAAALQAGRLWHVHIGDSNRRAPGAGQIDFAAVVATLRTHGYAGYLSAEHTPDPDPDAAAALFARQMRALLPRTPHPHPTLPAQASS